MFNVYVDDNNTGRSSHEGFTNKNQATDFAEYHAANGWDVWTDFGWEY